MIPGDPAVDALAALRPHFGHDSFRTGQQDLVETVLAGRDLLAVMPTGSGKSLGFQLRDVVDIARRTMAIPCEKVWGSMPARPWDASPWVANVRRVASTIDWRANTSFEDGLRRTITWLERAPEAVHDHGPAMR